MLIILSVVASILAAVRATSPTVTLASGVVVGTATSLPSARVSVNKYYGIPFARSPPERFSLPEDPAPWTGNYNASIAKPLCLQQFNCKCVKICLLQALIVVRSKNVTATGHADIQRTRWPCQST